MATTKVTTDVIDMSGNTGGLVWAKGTTAQRPAVGASTIGDLRENTETFRTEVYNNSGAWRNLKEATPALELEYLVVAGGAGGGVGGGGAGGLLTNYLGTKLSLSTATTYTIEVGIPGIGVSSNGGVPSGDGGDSKFGVVGSEIISTGGGGAGTGGAVGSYNNGQDGGSGGGSHASGTVGQGQAGQGFDGSVGLSAGGGGGGASASASTPSEYSGGNGGAGLQVNIDGLNNSYAGGGGGFAYSTGTAGTASDGGGAGFYGTGTGTSGGQNTGGGAGGGTAAGSNGGSGIVILRYPSNYTAVFSSGVTQVENTSISGVKINTITAAGAGETVIFS